MNSNRVDADKMMIIVSAAFAVLAIAAPIISLGQPIRFIATLGGIVLGPGSLAYRLATGSGWRVCLMIGLALNFATLTMLAFSIVAFHYWHPKIELTIPAATCVLAIVLYRRSKKNYHDKVYKGPRDIGYTGG